MKLRQRVFLSFIIAFVSALLLSAALYWRGTRIITETTKSQAHQYSTVIKDTVSKSIQQKQGELINLARSKNILEFVNQLPALDEQAREKTYTFIEGHSSNFTSIKILNRNGHEVCSFVEKSQNDSSLHNSDVRLNEEKIWTIAEGETLPPMIVKNSFVPVIRFTVPIFVGNAGNKKANAALVADIKLEVLLKDVNLFHHDKNFILITDKTGYILYHTNLSYRYQTTTAALSGPFSKIGEAIKRGESGLEFYDTAESSWLVSFLQIEDMDLSVVVGESYTGSLYNWKRFGLIGFGLITLFVACATWFLWRTLNKHLRNLNRVSVGTAAIAEGKLNQSPTTLSSDDLRPFEGHLNIINERFREQVRHEAETKQFQSFLRVSAVLAHDLKNSIAALFLLVKNMQKHYDNEDFRKDAMDALQGTVDKLQGLFEKLNRPSLSHSVEFRLPKPHDIVPIINRIASSTAKQDSKHEVEMNLPEKLIIDIDHEKIEKVIENLLLNAIEAMGESNGKITISAGKVNGKESFFSVTDTGEGMSEKFVAEKLFRPFSSTKKRGFGIGLYSCNEVITAHGGRIEVVSTINVGTTFKVVLPSDAPCE